MLLHPHLTLALVDRGQALDLLAAVQLAQPRRHLKEGRKSGKEREKEKE